jgi:hypothetical protein
MNIYEKKLKKTCEIIDTCFTLKEAYIKSINPSCSQKEIEQIIYDEILQRKEDQWKSQAS